MINDDSPSFIDSASERQSLDSILGKWSKGENKDRGLERLSGILGEIDSRLDFKQSARGWCYTLEGEGIIDKSEFDRAEVAINRCRKLGYLPLAFCAEDEARAFQCVEEPTPRSVVDHFRGLLNGALHAHTFYTPDWWDGERYYLQMLVEKIDLKSLYQPVCQQYHVPIANTSGWADLNQRGEMAVRFLAAEERGMECVLLYCGDFDPWGLKIEENLRKNLQELAGATGYEPDSLIIDRFGLNYDFIIENNLTWIDNLITGSGKDLTKSGYCWNCKIQHKRGLLQCRNCGRKLYQQPEFVRDYIEEYGARKCEANALVKVPEKGRQLCKEAIERYLGQDSISRFESKRRKVKRELDSFRSKHYSLFRQMEGLV